MTKLLLALINLPVKITIITYVFILNLFNKELSGKMKDIIEHELEEDPEQGLDIELS